MTGFIMNLFFIKRKELNFAESRLLFRIYRYIKYYCDFYKNPCIFCPKKIKVFKVGFFCFFRPYFKNGEIFLSEKSLKKSEIEILDLVIKILLKEKGFVGVENLEKKDKIKKWIKKNVLDKNVVEFKKYRRWEYKRLKK